MAAKRREARRWRPRRDWGRLIAFALCVVFAVIGAVPLGLGFLVRTAPVRAWAARETEALLAEKLGVVARYDVSVRAWPMVVALENVVVDASDGGTPFLRAERIAVRPRPFSLLAGHLDAGDVEIVGPHVRAVVEGGDLRNLRYQLPETKPSAGGGPLPLASLAVTDAYVDAVVEGTVIAAREIDVDVSAEPDHGFEIAVRAGQTSVTRVHPMPGRAATEDAVDDDVICRLEARVRVQGRSLLVRRLQLAGSADLDPDPGTRPSCALRETDWRGVEVRLGAVHVDMPKDGPIRAGGRAHVRVPAALAHRFVDVPHLTGSITIDVEGEYDGAVRLPLLSGHVAADRPGIDGKIFGTHLELDVATTAETIRATNLVTHWGDGTLEAPEIVVRPFAPGVTLDAGPITFEGVAIEGLVRDLGAHPQAHVTWSLDKGRFESFHGTLSPPLLEGPLTVQTHGFEIFDRPSIDPARAHMMGIHEGVVRCNFVVNGQARSRYPFPGVVLANAAIDTPRSHLNATVTLGFAGMIDIQVGEGSRVDLAEMSPLGDGIGIGGVAELRVGGHGPFEHPKLAGDIKVTDFVFAGFPIGDLEGPRLTFEPLVLDLVDARVRHGQSRVRAPKLKLDFDAGATVIADADVDTSDAPGLGLRDLFEVFHFEKDPRFADLDARLRGKARLRYVLGGREDRCGGGLLALQGSMDLEGVSLAGERFDGGTVAADLLWDDQLAGTAGMNLDVHSASLRKGDGSVLLGATVRHGGFVKGNVVASGIPVSRLDAFGSYGKLFDGTVSMVADVSGTLSALAARADVNLSRLRIGPATLGPSHLAVVMSPGPEPPVRGRTACGGPRAAPFDPAEAEKDLPAGEIRVDGALFDGQLAVDALRVSRQRHKIVRGTVAARGLDLGTLANLVPGVAYAGAAPRGALDATLDLKSLPVDAPQRAVVGLRLDALDLERAGARLHLLRPSGPIELRDDDLTVPDLEVQVRSGSGLAATVALGGAVHHATTAPDTDLGARLEPMDLAKLSADVPSVDRAGGTLEASLRIAGPPRTLRYAGSASLHKGEIVLKGAPVSVSEAEVDVGISGGEARLRSARARVGGGTVEVSGRVPLRGAELGAFAATVTARGVKLPVADGASLTADADLEVSYRPAGQSDRGQRNLPDVKGTVTITQGSYTRPFGELLSVGSVGQIDRAKRTNVDTYDPQSDWVRFNINVVAPRHPFRLSNNVAEMDFEVMEPGVVLGGTNQRFGARGLLRILPDGKLRFRNNEFRVREGYVRFDDPQKITPRVDLRAVTEYRRYASSAEQAGSAGASGDNGSGPTGASALSPASSTSTAGIWRITLQARGDPDDLQVSLTSDPALSQEDIVFLLTLGLTRAELDRVAASALGGSVGLEALSSLTGADKAVQKIVPLIDEFRFGTGYSARTARSEPTVTVGKRVTDDVRASVTTGVGDQSEVLANIEWRLNRQLSVQGSYDNLNDISSSPLGNLGVDLRWRIDFE